MSDCNKTTGTTEEMYATMISGTVPRGPVSKSTGRSFIPALPPNGKLARNISSGLNDWFSVGHRVNVLPGITQLVFPLSS